jgi:hypothetical protein
MAVIQSGAGSAQMTVETANNAARTTIYDAAGNQIRLDTDGNQRVQIRAPAFGALGAYSNSLTSGSIVATGSANAVIWALRWTDATRFCLIERVRVAAIVDSTITTAVPYNLQLFRSRGFTVSPTTSIGTTATLSSNNAKRRTSMGTSLMGGIWILGTAAAGLTGQTLGNDTDAFATIIGNSGTVVGTQFFGTNPTNLWDDNVDAHPLVLAQNDGLAMQAPLAGPATGTFRVSVSVDWMEVAAY